MEGGFWGVWQAPLSRLPGAGHKPSGRITRTVRVDPELWEWLPGSAKGAGTNASDRLDAVLKRARAGERRRPRERLEKEAGKKPKRRRRPPPKWIYTVKIGRSHPCPCGSGKKFRRCCLGKE